MVTIRQAMANYRLAEWAKALFIHRMVELMHVRGVIATIVNAELLYGAIRYGQKCNDEYIRSAEWL